MSTQTIKAWCLSVKGVGLLGQYCWNGTRIPNLEPNAIEPGLPRMFRTRQRAEFGKEHLTSYRDVARVVRVTVTVTSNGRPV